MKSKKILLAVIGLIAVLAVATGYAIWSANIPVHSNVTITGSRALVAYNSTSYTVLFSGLYNYPDSAPTVASITAPQAIFLKNTGQMPLIISWNTTGLPAGLTVLGNKAGDGITNSDHTSWEPYNADTPLTIQPGVTVDVSFNLQAAAVAYGSYNWDTVLFAVQG